MNKKSLIPMSALVVFGTITLADVQDRGSLPTTREWVGLAVVFTFLSAGADFGIPIAGGFAVLVMVAVLLSRGESALEFVVGKFESDKKRKRSKPYYPTHKTPQKGTLS